MRRQIALCIGNDDYQYSCLNKLECAVNDCNAIAEKLRTLNFDVKSYNNLDRDAMHTAVDDFEAQLPNYDIALFYYAGHGFECNGNNLLMPIDTNGTDRGYRDWMALKLDYVIDALEGKQTENNLETKIIIIDACRSNSDGRGYANRGFAPIFAPEGTIIAFSTSPGQSALELNRHGVYTNALLQSIDLPRIPIENMFKHVREILSASTGRRQISWEHTSLMGNYCFNEDRIDAFAFYSSSALADKNYYFKTDNQLYPIINGLKSHNWDMQNTAMDNISMLNFSDASANDLFVLGRNIYQSANGGAWNAEGFVRNFSNHSIPLEAKKHILCGMAYEIYYNRDGVLREVFKANHYIEILRLLQTETYQMSRNFISEKLMDESERIIYIPSSENKIELHLVCEELESKENGDIIYYIRSIYYQGINILYSADGTHDINIESYYYFRNASNLATLRTEIARTLVAPPDMLIVTLNIEDTNNHYFALPFSYSFRKSKLVE